MAQRLKRWESPRKEGRNDKGKGGSARQRQLKKRTQMLRQKLKDQGKNASDLNGQNKKGENLILSLFCEHDFNTLRLSLDWVQSIDGSNCNFISKIMPCSLTKR
jgi:hypothetical protein